VTPPTRTARGSAPTHASEVKVVKGGDELHTLRTSVSCNIERAGILRLKRIGNSRALNEFGSMATLAQIYQARDAMAQGRGGVTAIDAAQQGRPRCVDIPCPELPLIHLLGRRRGN
jgi:hypothetical protein